MSVRYIVFQRLSGNRFTRIANTKAKSATEAEKKARTWKHLLYPMPNPVLIAAREWAVSEYDTTR